MTKTPPTSTPRLEDLYTPEILALATAMPHVGQLEQADGEALAHSRLCGSRVRAQLRLDAQGRVAAFAQDVHACALGQAAAAILGGNVIGADLALLQEGRAALEAMLREGAQPPITGAWQALRALQPVRDYPPRHAAVLLPFDAAIVAMRKALEQRERMNGKAEEGQGA